jgi:hypothetical protein
VGACQVGYKEPFSDCEVSFLKALDQACRKKGLNLRVMGKMRVADLIEMNPKLKGQTFWKHFKKISQTHVDYSLLDQLKDDVFAAVGLPLIRFKPKYQYDLNVIAKELETVL